MAEFELRINAGLAGRRNSTQPPATPISVSVYV